MQRCLERGNLRLGLRKERGGLLHVKIRGKAVGEAVAGDCHTLTLRLNVLGHDRQPALVSAHVDVIARNITEQHHKRRAPVVFICTYFGARSLHFAAATSKDVYLPGSVDAALVDFVFKGRVLRQRHRAEDRLMMARLLAAVPTGGIGRRRKRCGGNAILGARLLDAGLGDPKVRIRADGPVDERIELGIVEGSPPSRGGVGCARFATGKRLCPADGSSGGGLTIIGTDGAAGSGHERERR